MSDFFHYLTPSEEDEHWGITLQVTGKSTAKPGTDYPSNKHPNGYYFTWDEGRILNEYQINYLTEGTGIYENEFGQFRLQPGSIFITFPGIWHRYRPDYSKGWRENYIGFCGPIIEQLIQRSTLSPRSPVLQIGVREEIMDTYLKIFDLATGERPGYQYVASGLIVKMMGHLIAIQREKGFAGKEIVKVIEKIRVQMRQELSQEMNIQQLAVENHISYSYLRKMFKKYTGISPGQYHLQLRIIRARELIISSDKTLKEICYELGFQSIHYFSRLFKAKLGLAPSDLRKKKVVPENRTQ